MVTRIERDLPRTVRDTKLRNRMNSLNCTVLLHRNKCRGGNDRGQKSRECRNEIAESRQFYNLSTVRTSKYVTIITYTL